MSSTATESRRIGVGRRDGNAILYIPKSTAVTVSVPVVTRPSVAFGKPVELPRVPRPGQLSVGFRGYDLLPDGRIVSLAPVSEAGQSTVEVRVVLNWLEELKRLVPTK